MDLELGRCPVLSADEADYGDTEVMLGLKSANAYLSGCSAGGHFSYQGVTRGGKSHSKEAPPWDQSDPPSLEICA